MFIQPIAKCWHAGILHEIKSVMSSAKYTISENIVKTVILHRGHLAQGVVATFAIALFLANVVISSPALLQGNRE